MTRRRGENVPELAALLREIAARIDAGTATSIDALALERLARQAEGKDRDWSVKVHGTKGQPAKSRGGVDTRLELARRVKAYRDQHGGSLEQAYAALDGTFNVSKSSIKAAWQEMSPFLDLSPKSLEIILFFKRFSASSDNAHAKAKRHAD